MTAPKTLYQTDLRSLKLRARGKVRDIYDIDQDLMLIVTSDRISAFDCILPDPIPGKGLILSAVSAFWFEKLAHVIPNQMTDIPLHRVIKDDAECALLEGRAIVVKKLKALPVEAVVRGYLIGSGWKDYQQHQSVCGLCLPEGLRQAEKLQEPLFTPSTKADLGDHDENIPFEKMEAILGARLAFEVREVSLKLYQEASAYALERGIIIADTKFEFGLDDEGALHLIDEVLTPDSSRFWPVDQYQVGISPPSFDKQFVRDYLESLDWNKAPPAPHLPEDILQKTSAKYREALERLTLDRP
ncbi:MAG: phosphoribosylaminoimidazolesuccinocarboxamide synthase [Gammaproteobacteria bacterium]|nr:phosphoribosylaminoimidazolesuccinocarboxamide synthase [Gammaproteobacteria bacterium]